MKELNLDTFREIIDTVLTDTHSALILESVEGTQAVTVKGLGGSHVLQFYFLLQALITIVAGLREELEIDAADPDWSETVDNILQLVRAELVPQEETEGIEA